MLFIGKVLFFCYTFCQLLFLLCLCTLSGRTLCIVTIAQNSTNDMYLRKKWDSHLHTLMTTEPIFLLCAPKHKSIIAVYIWLHGPDHLYKWLLCASLLAIVGFVLIFFNNEEESNWEASVKRMKKITLILRLSNTDKLLLSAIKMYNCGTMTVNHTVFEQLRWEIFNNCFSERTGTSVQGNSL